MDIINEYMFAELVARPQEKMSMSKLYNLRGKFLSHIPEA